MYSMFIFGKSTKKCGDKHGINVTCLFCSGNLGVLLTRRKLRYYNYRCGRDAAGEKCGKLCGVKTT